MVSSMFRDFRIPYALVSAYARDFSNEFNLSYFVAAGIILDAERSYRKLMSEYGGILLMSEPAAIQQLATQGAELASQLFLAEKGVAIEVPPEVIAAFVNDYVIPVVENDYDEEIAATLEYLREELPAHGFFTSSWYAWFKPAVEEQEGNEQYSFDLGTNYPNPFNPTTTVEYELPEGSHVRLTVYNMLGQEIEVLVDEFRNPGRYAVKWNGSNRASGVYLYRIQAGSYTDVKKMYLVK